MAQKAKLPKNSKTYDKEGTVDDKLLYSIINKQPKRADHYWLINLEFADTPIAGSPLLGAASFAGWTGFDTVSYIGAFDGSNNWMSGWTNFDPQNAQY